MTVENHRERDEPSGLPQVALVDLLDRLLATGVVLAGDVTLSIADIDLVHISLRAMVSSTSTLMSASDDRRRAG
jgi:hypothetical protein